MEGHPSDIEAQYTPDTSDPNRLDQAAETYQLYLQHSLGIDLKRLSNQDLRLLSYGTGNGADVIALHRMNPKIQILGAVDSEESKNKIVDPQTRQEIFNGITNMSVKKFIEDPHYKQIREQANVITGTRLGPETIKRILQSLNRDNNYIGIFSVGSLGVAFSGVENLLAEVLGTDWREQYAVKISGAGDMEDVFVITPRRKENPFLQFFQNDQEQ